MRRRRATFTALALGLAAAAWTSQTARPSSPTPAAPAAGAGVLRGQGALGDWTTDAPGVRRRITVADLRRRTRRVRDARAARVRAAGGRMAAGARRDSSSTEFQTRSRTRASSAPRRTATCSSPRAGRAESGSCGPRRLAERRDERGVRLRARPAVRHCFSLRPAPSRDTSTSARPAASSGSPTATAISRREESPR